MNKLQSVTTLTVLQLSQILSRLQQLRERISAAEDLVALELDHRRNQLFTFRVVRKDNFLKHSMAGSFLSTKSAHPCLYTASLTVWRAVAICTCFGRRHLCCSNLSWPALK